MNILIYNAEEIIELINYTDKLRHNEYRKNIISESIYTVLLRPKTFIGGTNTCVLLNSDKIDLI